LKDAFKPMFTDGAAPTAGNSWRLPTSSSISAGSSQLGTRIVFATNSRDLLSLRENHRWKLFLVVDDSRYRRCYQNCVVRSVRRSEECTASESGSSRDFANSQLAQSGSSKNRVTPRKTSRESVIFHVRYSASAPLHIITLLSA
jgi:hypothetical protein